LTRPSKAPTGGSVSLALTKAERSPQDEDGDEAMKGLANLKKIVNDSLQKENSEAQKGRGQLQ